MDITPFFELKPAPLALFATLSERRARVRFMVPAAGGGWRGVTWGDFAAQVRSMALGLRALGLRPGERVAIYAPNRVEWASAALAIQSAGAVVVPIYAGTPVEQLAYIVEHCDARVLFVDTAPLLERVLRIASTCKQLQAVIVLDEGLDAAPLLAELRDEKEDAATPEAQSACQIMPLSRLRARGDAEDQARPELFDAMLRALSLDAVGLLFYTSGTTGHPKGVPLTHRNVGVNGRDWLQCNHTLIEENAVDVLWLPMSHIFGFGETCLGNTLGFTTYLVDPFTVLDRLPEIRPSVFMSVPSYWEKLAQRAMRLEQAGGLAQLTGGRLRFCLSGGAGLKREIKDYFHRQGLTIIEGYGLTETSPTLTLNRPDSFDFDSVGRPLPSVELKLAEDGEILARGQNVFAGYHKDAEATAAAFTEDGWFRTGDIGVFTDRGFLKIVDRKKDILVTAGGKNVPPANIELRFRDDPLFEHVVVYGDGRRFLVAGVWLNAAEVERVLAGAPHQDVERLVRERIERINATLARHETIKRFRIIDRPLSVESGLLTASLKVRRRRVYEVFGAELEALYASDLPPAEASRSNEARS